MKELIGLRHSMTSLEIAGLTGKRHDNVITDIRQLIETYKKMITPEISGVTKSSYKAGTGKSYVMYELSYEATLDLVMGYSQELRIVIRQEWQAFKINNAKIILTDKERSELREVARLGCPELTCAVREHRLTLDKKTDFRHYVTEFDMINRIVLGMTAKKFRDKHNIQASDLIRDYMTKQEIEGIQELQGMNAGLVKMGLPFKQRKSMLISLHQYKALA